MSKVLDMTLCNGCWQWCSSRSRDRRTEVEPSWVHGSGSKAQADQIMRPSDVLRLEAADTEIEVDGPGGMDNEGQAFPNL
jgi:hypothetical protein